MNRHLLIQLYRRDVARRYRGSALGLGWMLLTPLMMLAVYSAVFGIIFKARWGSAPDGGAIAFPLLLFSGLMLHAMLAETLIRSASIIREHTAMVKKLVFPTHLLPLMAALTSLTHLAVQLVLLMLASVLCGLPISWHWLLIPVIIAPLWLLALAGGWLIAALSVFLSDVQQIIGLAMTLLLFLSPVFYPLSQLPESWQPLMALNPLAFTIESLRGLLYYQTLPTIGSYVALLAGSVLFAALAWRLFRRASPSFADHL